LYPNDASNIRLDSGLESIYRKEVKGWVRDDGIVKEDSEYTESLHI